MRRKVLSALAVLAVGVGGAAVAFAATGSDSSTISACIAKNGKVSIYPPNQACLASERPVTWNVQGPAGPPGPPGLSGTLPSNSIGGAITITGQGFDPAGILISGYTHEIVSPRDAASGLPTGKRQHKPLTITKEIDKATPLLMRAIFTNQTLPAVQMSLNGPDGKAVATVKLTNASVSDHLQQGSTETISFTYQKIEWTWIDGGITAQDDWEAPIG